MEYLYWLTYVLGIVGDITLRLLINDYHQLLINKTCFNTLDHLRETPVRFSAEGNLLSLPTCKNKYNLFIGQSINGVNRINESGKRLYNNLTLTTYLNNNNIFGLLLLSIQAQLFILIFLYHSGIRRNVYNRKSIDGLFALIGFLFVSLIEFKIWSTPNTDKAHQYALHRGIYDMYTIGDVDYNVCDINAQEMPNFFYHAGIALLFKLSPIILTELHHLAKRYLTPEQNIETIATMPAK